MPANPLHRRGKPSEAKVWRVAMASIVVAQKSLCDAAGVGYINLSLHLVYQVVHTYGNIYRQASGHIFRILGCVLHIYTFHAISTSGEKYERVL